MYICQAWSKEKRLCFDLAIASTPAGKHHTSLTGRDSSLCWFNKTFSLIPGQNMYSGGTSQTARETGLYAQQLRQTKPNLHGETHRAYSAPLYYPAPGIRRARQTRTTTTTGTRGGGCRSNIWECPTLKAYRRLISKLTVVCVPTGRQHTPVPGTVQ